MPNNNFDQYNIPGSGAFYFSAVRPGNLSETEYTLFTISVDDSGSTIDFKQKLHQALLDSLEACKKSPKANNILVRVVYFDSELREIHGFKPLNEIKDSDYPEFRCKRNTALYDSVFDSIGATLKYAEVLSEQDFYVNAINFILTDGVDNESRLGISDIKRKIEDALKSEKIESILNVLVGINTVDSTCKSYLENFQKEANINQFIDIGEASPAQLAKLGQFISRSTSSASQSLGTGQSVGPLVF
jgi:hypothetical protein